MWEELNDRRGSGDESQSNQNNNIQQPQAPYQSPTNCYQPLTTYSPTSTRHTPPTVTNEDYFPSTVASNHSPIAIHIDLTKTLPPGSTPSPVSSPQEQQRHKRLQSACPGPNQLINTKQEVPSPSHSFSTYSATNCVSSSTETGPYHLTPTSSPNYQQYTSSAPLEPSSCEKGYQIQYSISATSQPSPRLPIGSYSPTAAAVAYYAAAASHNYARSAGVTANSNSASVESADWLRKYGSMTAMVSNW